MLQKTQDLTQGNLRLQILSFSVPLAASNMLQVLFNMSDIAVVGRYAGAEALGSVGSTATLVTLYTGFLIGMGSGINALVARYLGAHDKKNISETVHSSFIISLCLGLLISVFCFFCSPLFLRLLGTKDELIDGAVLYLRIYSLGLPAMAIYNFGNAVFSAAGNTRKPLAYLSVAGVINVILNLFFVIVCKMAAGGVALATIISQSISAVLMFISLVRSEADYRVELRSARLYRGKTGPILTLGLTSGFQHAIFALANLFIQGAVNTFDAVVVEGNSAAANADSIVYEVMAAVHTACASFIGQNYGAHNKRRIRNSYFLCTAYSFGIGAILGLSLVIFGRSFLSLFTTEEAVINAGMLRLNVMGLSYAFSAFMDCTISAARGLGKSVVPMIIVIIGSCIFRVVWIYTVFAYFRTIRSLYLLYIFSWAITAAAEMIYFYICYRRQVTCMSSDSIITGT